MSLPEPERSLADQPAATIIQQIKAGVLAPSTLPKEQRQRCVEALLLEGSTHSQIAQLLACSEKTIQRELNILIERGLIRREGERRWSVYLPV